MNIGSNFIGSMKRYGLSVSKVSEPVLPWSSTTNQPESMAVRDIDTSESRLKQLLERIRRRHERPRYGEDRNLDPTSPVPATTSIKKRTKKIRRIISLEEIEVRRLKGICVFCDEPETPDHYLRHKNAGLFMINGDEDQLSYDKELVQSEVESDSFLKSDLVHQRNLILDTKSMMESDSGDDESCRAAKEIQKVKSVLAKDLEVMSSEPIAVSLNDVDESLEVVLTDSFSGINSNQEAEAHSVHRHEELEKEVRISLLEPSYKIDEMRSVLIENSSSPLLVNDSRYVGVWFAPKVEESFILDVEVMVELVQNLVASVDGVARQVLDQLLLQCCKMNQRKYQKDWTFKYKVNKFVKEKIEQPRVKQEKLLIFWEFDFQTKSMRQSTEISMTSLRQNEKKRFISLACRFQKRAVEQDQVVNAVAEVLLRSEAELGRSRLMVSLKGYNFIIALVTATADKALRDAEWLQTGNEEKEHTRVSFGTAMGLIQFGDDAIGEATDEAPLQKTRGFGQRRDITVEVSPDYTWQFESGVKEFSSKYQLVGYSSTSTIGERCWLLSLTTGNEFRKHSSAQKGQEWLLLKWNGLLSSSIWHRWKRKDEKGGERATTVTWCCVRDILFGRCSKLRAQVLVAASEKLLVKHPCVTREVADQENEYEVDKLARTAIWKWTN